MEASRTEIKLASKALRSLKTSFRKRRTKPGTPVKKKSKRELAERIYDFVMEPIEAELVTSAIEKTSTKYTDTNAKTNARIVEKYKAAYAKFDADLSQFWASVYQEVCQHYFVAVFERSLPKHPLPQAVLDVIGHLYRFNLQSLNDSDSLGVYSLASKHCFSDADSVAKHLDKILAGTERPLSKQACKKNCDSLEKDELVAVLASRIYWHLAA